MTPSEARRRLNNLKVAVFSNKLLAKINLYRIQLLVSRDRSYVEQRSSSSKQIADLIERILALPIRNAPTLQAAIEKEPLSVLTFLLDRFLFVDEYLSKLMSLESAGNDADDTLFRWALIDIWNSLPHGGDIK